MTHTPHPEAPERIWIKADVDRSVGGDFAWFTPFTPNQPSIEYVRVDRADALRPAASEGAIIRAADVLEAEGYMPLAKELRQARPAASEGDGVLVTPEMICALHDVDPTKGDWRYLVEKWTPMVERMLSAAPKPPQSPSDISTREIAKSTLGVLCSLRDSKDWHDNTLKDINFAIEGMQGIVATGPQFPSLALAEFDTTRARRVRAGLITVMK